MDKHWRPGNPVIFSAFEKLREKIKMMYIFFLFKPRLGHEVKTVTFAINTFNVSVKVEIMAAHSVTSSPPAQAVRDV